MENAQQLAQRFKDVILEGKWIANTNFKHQVSDLTYEQALQKVSSLNSIALLTFHINYYISGVLNVFEGGNLEIRDKYSFDMPEIDSQKKWEDLRNQLWSNAEKFASHIENMSPEQLSLPFVDEKYGNYRRNIEGMIEHAYYHLGQVVLLKKLILLPNTP